MDVIKTGQKTNGKYTGSVVLKCSSNKCFMYN